MTPDYLPTVQFLVTQVVSGVGVTELLGIANQFFNCFKAYSIRRNVNLMKNSKQTVCNTLRVSTEYKEAIQQYNKIFKEHEIFLNKKMQKGRIVRETHHSLTLFLKYLLRK